MSVADDHAAVEAQLAGSSCRYHLDFRGKEVRLLDAVLVGQKLQRERFHRFLRGVLALCALAASGFALGVLAVDGQRTVADEDV